MNTQDTFIKQPIFLVGAERSGTTLLRLMLDNHPNLAWCYEFEYAVDLIPDDNNCWPELGQYYQWLETHRTFQSTGFTIDSTLDYPSLINSFLLQKQDKAKKLLVGATVHRHFHRLLRIWPDARFIHIIRDGRDVARSCIGMGWTGNVWTGIEQWLEAETLWNELEKQLPPNQRMNLTYEELILDPVKTLKQICNFIGIEYDEAMLSYPQTTTYSLPDPKMIEQWKRKMSKHDVQLVESRIASILVERGYKLSGLPPLKVNFLMRQKIKLQDWWYRIQFRINLYSFPLFLSDFFARHLRLYQWQKSIKLKLNAIENAQLK
ncbi:sulfotransferase [Chondrocystis sp. NIES-4102]|nr:sulfotransferase [Chondrocystis sp. NIES-4102]